MGTVVLKSYVPHFFRLIAYFLPGHLSENITLPSTSFKIFDRLNESFGNLSGYAR